MKCKLILLSFLLVMFAYSTTLVSADGTFDTNGHIGCGNENYSFASVMTFDDAKGNNDWVMFNNVYFNITSVNPINISLSYLNPNILTASQGDLLLRFNANTTGGTVWFNLSGFVANREYDVFRDSVILSHVTANASGGISFSSSVWSDHQFEFRDDQGGNTTQLRVTYDYQYVHNFWDTIYSAYGLLSLLGVITVAVLIVTVLIRSKMEK